MPRKPKFIPGPSRLSKVLEHLTKAPRPYLRDLVGLKLMMAYRNNHFGARHFVKDDLPRIQYANPGLKIEVTKKPKSKEETWKPEMTLQLRDGTTKTMNLDGKWSSAIFQELMDLAGGSSWERWKRERAAAGLPIVEVPIPKKVAPKAPSWGGKKQAKEEPVQDELLLDSTKTGAAAVLP